MFWFEAAKYYDIITNSIILQNIVDISDIIHQLIEEKYDIRENDIAFLRPYMIEYIKHFGDYFIEIGQRPHQITEGPNCWQPLNSFKRLLDSYKAIFTDEPTLCPFERQIPARGHYTIRENQTEQNGERWDPTLYGAGGKNAQIHRREWDPALYETGADMPGDALYAVPFEGNQDLESTKAAARTATIQK